MMFCCIGLVYEEASCCSFHSCFAYTHLPLCKLSTSQPQAAVSFQTTEEVKHYRQKGKAGSSEITAWLLDPICMFGFLSCVCVFLCLFGCGSYRILSLQLYQCSMSKSKLICESPFGPRIVHCVCKFVCVCAHSV